MKEYLCYIRVILFITEWVDISLWLCSVCCVVCVCGGRGGAFLRLMNYDATCRMSHCYGKPLECGIKNLKICQKT